MLFVNNKMATLTIYLVIMTPSSTGALSGSFESGPLSPHKFRPTSAETQSVISYRSSVSYLSLDDTRVHMYYCTCSVTVALVNGFTPVEVKTHF